MWLRFMDCPCSGHKNVKITTAQQWQRAPKFAVPVGGPLCGKSGRLAQRIAAGSHDVAP